MTCRANSSATLGGDAFTALFIPKEQTWRRIYADLANHGQPITDPVFLDHMKIRLGWEYFADLTFRSHLSHTLEINEIAVADVPAEALVASAEKLSRQLHNQFPSTEPIAAEDLTRFLVGILQQMRRQGSAGHRYVDAAIATGTARYGLNYFGAATQMDWGAPTPCRFPTADTVWRRSRSRFDRA